MASLLSSFGAYIPVVSRTSIVVTAAAITTVTIFTVFKFVYRKRETRKNAATVTGLTIYPIKSVAGIVVDHLDVTPNCVTFNGFADRSMVLLNSENRMITLRQNGSLATIRSSFTGNGELTLKAHAMEDLIIHSNRSPGNSDQVIHFSIWGYDTSGVEVSPQASDWFSRFLKQSGVRLVTFTPKCTSRPTHVADTRGGKWQLKYKIRYQDGSPVHLTNEATLNALNSLAQSSGKYFDMKAFRPNIVITSPIAMEELSWYSCAIDGINFYNVRACTRCVIPTMDPSTGERDAQKTPLMQSHRSAANEYEVKNYQQNALFGLNLVPDTNGTVTVGSSVDVTV